MAQFEVLLNPDPAAGRRLTDLIALMREYGEAL
jgi:hypothetical protein